MELVRALDMAGGAAADRDRVLPRGPDAELRIERDNAEEPAFGDVQHPGEPGHVLFRNMAEGLLNALKKGDQTAFLLPVLIQYFRENFFHDRWAALVSDKACAGKLSGNEPENGGWTLSYADNQKYASLGDRDNICSFCRKTTHRQGEVGADRNLDFTGLYPMVSDLIRVQMLFSRGKKEPPENNSAARGFGLKAQ